jgi:hypothetical protein
MCSYSNLLPLSPGALQADQCYAIVLSKKWLATSELRVTAQRREIIHGVRPSIIIPYHGRVPQGRRQDNPSMFLQPGSSPYRQGTTCLLIDGKGKDLTPPVFLSSLVPVRSLTGRAASPVVGSSAHILQQTFITRMCFGGGWPLCPFHMPDVPQHQGTYSGRDYLGVMSQTPTGSSYNCYVSPIKAHPRVRPRTSPPLAQMWELC